jgi:hypothetical protein
MNIQTGLNPDGYWFALDDDTYDVDCDQDGFFSTSHVGYGKTEQEAIDDLLELDEDDGQPSEAQEWSDYDRDC